MIDTWSLPLPYRRPPLTLNQRIHFMAEHRLKGELKQAAIVLAKHHRIPRLRAITAELAWYKGDNRRADADNISPTLKPLLDGLVAAGVIPEDHASHVLRTSTRVIYRRDDPHPECTQPRLFLRIRDMSALAINP